MIEFLAARRFNHIDMLGSCAVAYAMLHGQYALVIAVLVVGAGVSVVIDRAIARLHERPGRSE